MSPDDVAFLVFIVVASAVVVRQVRVLWYGKPTQAEQTLLAQSTLVHYTSTASGALIDQGNGTVHLAPRTGWRARITELLHGNSAGFLHHTKGAVYLYATTPPPHIRRFHRHANDVAIEVPGTYLTPGQLYCSPHDSAVAVRGGYRGPGRVVPVTNPPDPPPRTRR